MRALVRPLHECRVLVIGGGAIGMLAALLLKRLGVKQLTLAEITLLGTYPYTTADLQATVTALHSGQFGKLDWVEVRPLTGGVPAFVDLDRGHSASAKIVLPP